MEKFFVFWVGTEFLNIPYTNFLFFGFKFKTFSLRTKSNADMTKGVKFCYWQRQRRYKSAGFWKEIQENK
jgi:hypothetical protein